MLSFLFFNTANNNYLKKYMVKIKQKQSYNIRKLSIKGHRNYHEPSIPLAYLESRYVRIIFNLSFTITAKLRAPSTVV